MLKITYLDSGLLLERLSQPVEALVAQHSTFATRLGHSLSIQPAFASILLLRHLPNLEDLLTSLRALPEVQIEVCDSLFLEISLPGTWITETPTCENGIFATRLEVALERQLVQAWRQSQAWTTQEAGLLS